MPGMWAIISVVLFYFTCLEVFGIALIVKKFYTLQGLDMFHVV